MNKLQQKHTGADSVVLILTTILIILGFVIMASASTGVASSPFYYVNKQGVAMFAGLLGAWLAFNVPYYRWRDARVFIFFSIVVLMIAVLVVGDVIRGARRWINFGGFSIQVVEFVKIGLIIYVAAYLEKYRISIQESFTRLLGLLFWCVVIVGLSLLQPDFGNAVVMMTVVIAMSFMAGIKARWLALLFVLMMLFLVIAIWFEPYRMERVASFLDGIRDPLSDSGDSGYQRTRSLSAIARGGFFGQGLGDSLFKHGKLPFAHSDFIFSIYAEELGLIGILGLVFLCGLFVIRAFQIGLRAEAVQRYFAANICFGIGSLFAVQWLFNIAVCLGLLPPKGMTMPFFSVGGSSLMASLIAIGILARAKFEVDDVVNSAHVGWLDEMGELNKAEENVVAEPEVIRKRASGWYPELDEDIAKRLDQSLPSFTVGSSVTTKP
jgi:cell division protein FtsW